MFPKVHITATDPGGTNVQQDLARMDLGHGLLDHVDLNESCDDGKKLVEKKKKMMMMMMVFREETRRDILVSCHCSNRQCSCWLLSIR
jgi:hypothetical protein